MSSQIYELLTKLKSKTFTKSDYQLVKQTAQKESRAAVNLWRFKPQVRTLFKMGKYQSYLMLLLGLTVLPFTLYQKYEEDKQKLTKILIFAPFGFGACLAPIIMYKRFSKKLIQAISFNFENKKLILTRFRDGKQIYADLNDISTTKSDKGRVKQLLWKKTMQGAPQFPFTETRTYQIEGLGEWESSQMLEYLISTSNKESL